MINRLYRRPVLVPVPPELEWSSRVAEASGDVSLPLIEALIPLLDGRRSIEEILGALLMTGFEVESIFSALTWLDQQGFLHEAPSSELSPLPDDERQYYAEQIQALATFPLAQADGPSALPTAGVSAQYALKRSQVAIIGLGTVGSQLAGTLARAGVGHIIGIAGDQGGASPSDVGSADSVFVSAAAIRQLNPFVEFELIEHVDDSPAFLSAARPDLFIYCPDYFDEAFCEWLNQICLSYAIPLILYRRRPLHVEIGPLIIPRQTGCYVCYDRRRKAVVSDVKVLTESEDHDPPQLNFVIGLDWLTLDIVKFITRVAEPATRNRLCRIDLVTGLMQVHSVLKLPRCPACGVHKSQPARKLWEE